MGSACDRDSTAGIKSEKMILAPYFMTAMENRNVGQPIGLRGFRALFDRCCSPMLRSALPSALVAVLALCSPVFCQGVYFVHAGLTTGANDGSSWSDAFRGSAGLAEALSITPEGSDIYIAEGTYIPRRAPGSPARFAYFPVRRHRLWGGFVGGETSPAERPSAGTAITVLSGDLLGDDLLNWSNRAENSLFVVSAFNGGFTLDRLTLTGGEGEVTVQGGGRGGALATWSGPSMVRDCRFVRNRSAGGGAVYVSADVEFVRCSFEQNVSTGFGGAIQIWGSSADVRITNCTFSDNVARVGAAASASHATDVHFVNCSFVGNGTRGPVIANTINGGALAFNDCDAVELINCTIARNRSENDPRAGIQFETTDLSAHNCIVWGNTGSSGLQNAEAQAPPDASLNHSVVHPAHLGGINNVPGPPGFIDASGGDFSLAPGSSAIDIGDSTRVPSNVVVDVVGGERFQDVLSIPDQGVPLPFGPVVDAGSFEFQAGQVGLTRCISHQNSTGAIGTIGGLGSHLVSRNDLTIVAAHLPPVVTSLLVVSRQRDHVPAYNNSMGTLCLGPQFGRFENQISATDGQGAVTFSVDLAALPLPSVAARPGDRLHFQVWHRDRDTLVPIPTSNLTNGLLVWLQ